jgi:hypothetical protein
MAYALSNSLEPPVHDCLSPESSVRIDDAFFSNMISSHDWSVEYSKPHGNGVYVAFYCKKCGAIGHAIIENR